MDSDIVDRKVFFGIPAICEFLRIGRDKFHVLRGLGMPVELIGKTWVGHRNNLERLFELYTADNLRNLEVK